MRPQLFSAAATIALRVASLVTSAAKAKPLPPSFAIIATVSSAEPRSRSTAITVAPSCAKRSAVARPLPMPVPGPCPPTTIANLPARRVPGMRLPRRQPHRAVDADALAVDMHVVDDVQGEPRIFVG